LKLQVIVVRAISRALPLARARYILAAMLSCHLIRYTLGLLLNVDVHPADVQGRDAAFMLLRRARRLFPFIERIFADGGYAEKKMARVVRRKGAWKLKIGEAFNHCWL
jgi:hypothetical protein